VVKIFGSGYGNPVFINVLKQEKLKLISVTIALTRYNEPNGLLQQCLESIAAQKGVCARVFVLDQYECSNIRNLCVSLSSGDIAFEYNVIPARGCAHARNIALRRCSTDILLWTDPDVLLAPDWAETLCRALQERNFAVVGGKIMPRWHKSPSWYMKTNVMADHYSLIDFGPEDRETDRIIGGSMGINAGRLGEKAFFDERLGRKDGTLLGGVDAEFCQRIMRHGFAVCYTGRTAALHQIPESRMKLSWIVRKFYYGGISRGMRGGRPQAMNTKRKMADYIVLGVFAPFYLFGLFIGKKKGRIASCQSES
jgi:glycosyltransferase involved in cell wall biosynthesis